jgi:hypothetical protein
MDCAGVCGGKAVVDECGECVLGTTGREFNAAKDCAGQCFGGRLPTDPYANAPPVYESEPRPTNNSTNYLIN